MFCVCIAEPDFNKCLKIIEKEALAEIRIDLVGFSNDQVKQLFGTSKGKLIATFREGKKSAAEREETLKIAIHSGAAFIDIEYEAAEGYRKRLVEAAKSKGCEVIISYHDFEKTPSQAELNQVIKTSESYGADIIKIACMVKGPKDMARLMALYDNPNRIIAFGMGAEGKFSRIASLFLGAEFTYVSYEGSEGTAPGQLTRHALQDAYRYIANQ
jgi:3-dehydroquinate dehydratase I